MIWSTDYYLHLFYLLVSLSTAQGSKDGVVWVTLSVHVDDTHLNAPGSTNTWTIKCPLDEKVGSNCWLG